MKLPVNGDKDNDGPVTGPVTFLDHLDSTEKYLHGIAPGCSELAACFLLDSGPLRQSQAYDLTKP